MIIDVGMFTRGVGIVVIVAREGMFKMMFNMMVMVMAMAMVMVKMKGGGL